MNSPTRDFDNPARGVGVGASRNILTADVLLMFSYNGELFGLTTANFSHITKHGVLALNVDQHESVPFDIASEGSGASGAGGLTITASFRWGQLDCINTHVLTTFGVNEGFIQLGDPQSCCLLCNWIETRSLIVPIVVCLRLNSRQLEKVESHKKKPH